MVDWYPTLLKLAGASTEQKLKPDGLDIWPTITQGKPTPHDAILINSIPESGAIRMGDWKLVVNGHIGANDLEAAKKKSTTKNAAKQSKDSRSATVESSIELFNLRQDPFETTNLAKENSNKVLELKARLDAYAQEAVPPKAESTPTDFKAPKIWGEAAK